MHVFPRAMMFRIRGAEKHLVAGHRNRNGVHYRQSGLWDDRVICEVHERMFGAADDYAMEVCRRIEHAARLTASGNALEIDNPQPDLLVCFACATVWRHVVSGDGQDAGLDLGPYRALLETYLFSDGEAPTQALVGKANLTAPNGQPIQVAVSPYRQKLLDWNVWHFTMGPLDVFLKTDKRLFPLAWSPYLANDNDPLTLIRLDAMRFDQISKFQPIFRNMTRRR